GRIDPGEADAGLTERLAEFAVIDAGGFEDDKCIASPTRHQLCDGMWHVGDAFRCTDGFVEDIEMMFGDVDSDATMGYDHGACPCDARSVGAASCNCSGWIDGTGGRQSRLTASSAKDPTASRPPHHDRSSRHRDPSTWTPDQQRTVSCCAASGE